MTTTEWRALPSNIVDGWWNVVDDEDRNILEGLGKELAHLIAASREMQKALEKIVRDWDGEPEDMFDARAALAKSVPKP